MSQIRAQHGWGTFGLILVLAGVSALLLPSTSGCQAAPEDDLRNCDIPALFASSCSGSACHSAGVARADLDLESPGVDQRLFHVLGTPDCDERKLIVPGHPEESLLYLKVSEAKPFCGKPMPLDRDLSKSELACLKNYIENAGTESDGTKCETCGGILCADFERDPQNCGGCDAQCEAGQVCGGGVCVNPCAEGETLCGASCVLVGSSDNNCGQCGHRCGPGSSCEEGVCACSAESTDPVGEGGAPGEVESEVPSFKEEILPMFSVSCSGSDCHTEGGEAPLNLEAALAYANIVNVEAEDCAGKRLVVPGSPDTSYLVDKLMGGNICEGGRMPLADEPLPNLGIARVVRWICAGAPDN